MIRTELEIGKQIGDTPFKINISGVHTKFNNEDLKKLVPEWQKKIELAYKNKGGTNMKIGATLQGKTAVISFSAKIPVSKLKF